MTSAISTELKFVPLEARNWKGPKVGRDEGRAEYDEPLNVAQRRRNGFHRIEPVPTLTEKSVR